MQQPQNPLTGRTLPFISRKCNLVLDSRREEAMKAIARSREMALGCPSPTPLAAKPALVSNIIDVQMHEIRYRAWSGRTRSSHEQEVSEDPGQDTPKVQA